MEWDSIEKIGINDIDKLILLAEDVFVDIRYHYSDFDDEGRMYEELYDGRYGDFKKDEELLELVRRKSHEWINSDDFLRLHEYIFKDRTVTQAEETTVAEFEEVLAPFRRKMIGIFRNGSYSTHIGVRYCVDESVSDDFLMKLFAFTAMRYRMIYNALYSNKEKSED